MATQAPIQGGISVDGIKSDPGFYQLSPEAQTHVMDTVDPDFKSLSPEAKTVVIQKFSTDFQQSHVKPGLQNVVSAVGKNVGQAAQGIGNLITHPMQTAQGIGNAFKVEGRNFNGLNQAGGLAGGAALGLADLYNGAMQLPSDIGNAYMGKPTFQPAAPLIPTGGLQQYTSKMPVSSFLGGLAPFAAADALTGGAAAPAQLSMLGRFAKAAGIGAAYGGLSDAHGQGLGGRVQNAVNMGVAGAALHGLSEIPRRGAPRWAGSARSALPNMLKGRPNEQKIQQSAAPERNASPAGEADPHAAQRQALQRNDAAERQTAQQLRQALASANVDEKIAAQNAVKGYQRLAQVKIKATTGEARYSPNPIKRLRQEQAQRVLFHLENAGKEAKVSAAAEKALRQAREKQAVDANKAQLKAEAAQEAKRAKQLQEDIKRRSKEMAEMEKSDRLQKATIEKQQAQQAIQSNKALNKAEAAQRARENAQLKAAIKQRADLNKEANKELVKIRKTQARREALLGEDNLNTAAIHKTRFSPEQGLGTQNEAPASHFQFADVKEAVDALPGKHKMYARLIDKAMREDKPIELDYKAEITGHTSTLPTKKLTPIAWKVSERGVYFKAYNEFGHEGNYYLHANDGTSEVLTKPQILDTEKPFIGTSANVYHGTRFYKLDDVLNRPERDAGVLHSQVEALVSKNEALADYVKKNPKTPLEFILKMADMMPVQEDVADRWLQSRLTRSDVMDFSDSTEELKPAEIRQLEQDVDC